MPTSPGLRPTSGPLLAARVEVQDRRLAEPVAHGEAKRIQRQGGQDLRFHDRHAPS
jgi:hypothetical protein